MNQEDLLGALDELAGPPPHPTRDARAAVAGRVRRARRRITAASSVVVVVVGFAAFGVVQSSALDAPTRRVDVAANPRSCVRLPPKVPRASVPVAVRNWAGRGAIVGGGSLWTVRRVLSQRPVHEGPVFRLKLGWFVTGLTPTTPAPVLTARQVDGPGRATGDANRATNEKGTWFASTIELTGARTCWEITAKQGPDVIRFRRLTGRG